MKKYVYCAVSVFLMVACAKQETPVQDDFSDAPWALDESVSVPIILSSGDPFSVKTKAPINNLDGVQFGVLALDTLAVEHWAPDDESVILFNKVAVKGEDGYAQFITPEGNVTYYYPLKTVEEHDYAFFGYHTSDVPIQENATVFDGAFSNGTFEKEVVIDSVDVLWAKATAKPLEHEGAVVSGFNTKYARQSRLWYPGTWKTEYTPKFVFKHLTTAFHFNVLADPTDPAAAASFLDEEGNALVTVSNIRVSDVYQRAVLNVLTGELTPDGEKGSTVIDAAPLLPRNADGHNEYGTGLFLLPMSAEDLAVSPVSVNFDITFPNPGSDTPKVFTPAEGFVLPLPSGADSFEAGKSYTFNIIIKSLERVYIQLDLEEWIDGFSAEDDNVVTTIG